MPDFRCPKHDRVFETATDSRKPGALATANLPAHPHDGHPDCPKCAEELSGKTATRADVVAAARARAAAARDAANAAAAAAQAAADEADDAANEPEPVGAGAGRRIG